MTTVILASLLLIAAATAVWLAMRALLPRLIAWDVMDRPNARSSHVQPVPRGGGLAVVAGLMLPLVAFGALAFPSSPAVAVVIGGCFAGLAALSWRDDRKSLPASVRLAAHALAVAATLVVLPTEILAFQGWLPLPLDRVVAGLVWIWFINLYNFMDGIDGITGTETASIGVGLALVVMMGGLSPELVYLGAALAGVSIGFLLWNWSPARVFLGDVGSIPLGYAVGLALLLLAGHGYLAAALILPLYYLMDATTTLLRRLLRGAPVWQAHREHAYQTAAAVIGHAPVVIRLAGLNAVLIVLAVLSTVFQTAMSQWLTIAVAMILTSALLLYFHRLGRAAS